MKKLFGILFILVIASFLILPAMAGSSSVNVKNFGAKGDGQTDDTAAIQRALKEYDTVYIPEGIYLINPDKSLYPKSNQTIILSDNAILKALPSACGYYNIFKISAENNVTISGGKIIGERYDHRGTDGAFGSGILVCTGSTNIKISNITVTNCWGDGFLIGDNATSSNIQIDHVVADNNRRSGMSICSAQNVSVSNSVFKNSNGSYPCAGINVEPNSGSTTSDIVFTNNECSGNAVRGLSLSGYNGFLSEITVKSCSIHDNTQVGLFMENVNSLTCSDTSCFGNTVGITILKNAIGAYFSNMMIYQNNDEGVLFYGSHQNPGIDSISFVNSKFFNNSQNSVNKCDGVYIDSDSTGYVNNIAFFDCDFFDNQDQPTQRYGLTISSFLKNSNILIDTDCNCAGNASGGYYVN